MGSRAILLVDTDSGVLATLADVAAAAGYAPRLADSFEVALEWLKTDRFDFLATAHRLVTHNGLNLVLRARNETPDIGAIVTTPLADPVLDREAADFGALTVVAPWHRPQDLLSALSRSKGVRPIQPVP